MTTTLNKEIRKILKCKPNEYRNKLFCIRLNVKGNDVEIVNEYYYIVRTLSYVAKKYFNADYESLLKKYALYFWQPKKYMTEEGWFENQLLIKISILKHEIRELRFERISLHPDKNYIGVNRIDYQIGEYQFEMEYLQQVVDYILIQKWKEKDYVSFDIYLEKVHQLPLVKRLEKDGFHLADIIDDINMKRTVVYTTVLFYKLGLPQKMRREQKTDNYEEISKVLSYWFVKKADYKTIVKVFNYLEKMNNKMKKDKLIPSYEKNLAIIREKYKMA